MKLKVILSAVLISFLSLSAAGQSEEELSRIPKIVPASPDASALEKFVNIPVDYSTGIPSIGYPIWSWNRGLLTYNIGLGYHAGGHKVDDIASNVGLGWSLSGLPRVSRTVKGTPDENFTRGYFHTGSIPTHATVNYDPEQYYIPHYWDPIDGPLSTTVINKAQSGVLYNDAKKFAEGLLDGEQDIFSYGIDGHSGRFIMSKTQEIIPLEETNVRIEKIGTSIGDGFKITSDAGILYEFTVHEYQSSLAHSNSGSVPESIYTNYVSSWLIKKIVNLNTNDSIIFNYGTPFTTKYETGFTESDTRLIEEYRTTNSTNLPHASLSRSMSMISNTVAPLTSVSFPDGTNLLLAHNFSRIDLEDGKALTEIELKNAFNTSIKKWQFHYSYFISSNDNPSPWLWGYFSESDYQKRLRLDSIVEKGETYLQDKATLFTYNSTALNSRGSKNIDFWGYNVNPARNNGFYMPTIRLAPFEASVLGVSHLLSANRMPDPVYGKAALLEQINYPTGGFSKFEYESHKAHSDLDYNQITNHVGPFIWEEQDFNLTIPLLFTDRLTQDVHFLFKVIEEVNPRPVPDPESPSPCLENQQDGIAAYFKITSTDNTVSHTIGQYYADFIAGLDTVLVLPLDKTYTIQYYYNNTATCADQYPYMAKASAYFINPSTEQLVGGMRIKKITLNPNGIGKSLEKSYTYLLENNTSSATLRSVPNFSYSRYALRWTMPPPSPLFYTGKQINFTSNPTNTYNYHNGGPLIYTRVIETDTDNGSIERYYDDMSLVEMGNTSLSIPYTEVQDLPNLSGLLTKEIVLNAEETILQEKEITYTKTITSLAGNENCRNIKTGNVAALTVYEDPNSQADHYYVMQPQFYRISYAKKSKETTKIRDGSNLLTTTQDYTYYSPSNYLKKIETTDSKNKKQATELDYVINGTGPVMSAMQNKHMLNFPTYKNIYNPENLTDGNLRAIRINYAGFQGGTLHEKATVETKLLLNSYETDMTVSAYDPHGNISELTARDGMVSTFLWAYKSQYPVAKVVGSDYTTVSGIINQATLDNGNQSQIDAQLSTLRSAFATSSTVQVTTYKYKPLVGVIAETAPNGKNVFYEYDSFNRLHLVKDDEGKILKRICYNYAGLVEDCGVEINTTPLWESTGLTRCQPCPANNSYVSNIQEHQEKDNNPHSPTYNTYRWISDGVNSNCTPPADWQNTATAIRCKKDGTNQNTGEQEREQRDMNPCSPTYNQLRWIVTGTNTTACPLPYVCSSGNCWQEGYKCVYGNCELGVRICVSSAYDWETGMYANTYRYEWSDGSWSSNFIEMTHFACAFSEF